MKTSFTRLAVCALVGATFLSATIVALEAKPVAAAPPSAPACAIGNFFISGRQSDGGAGSYDTFVYLTNSGSTCRLTPIDARAYNDIDHVFVGTAASIAKPDVTTGQMFPYATRRLLGTVTYGESVSLFLSYADVSPETPNGCGKIVTANSMAFWIAGKPHMFKVVHLVFYLRGWSSTLRTCSKARYLGVSWPSTGPFWFASSPYT
jgi:hypothetical protein